MTDLKNDRFEESQKEKFAEYPVAEEALTRTAAGKFSRSV